MSEQPETPPPPGAPDPQRPPAQAAPVEGASVEGPSFLRWMGTLWGYSLLRFGMFFALWGILLLVGLGGLLAAVIALVLSIPLSLVLLSGPRARVAQQVEQRVEAARVNRQKLDEQLDPDAPRD